MKTITRNLRAVYQLASCDELTRGKAWYSDALEASRAIAARYIVPVSSVVGVVAALSPGYAWDRNIAAADDLIDAWTYGAPLPVVGSYGRANIDKALRILVGANPLAVLGGDKVRAFYRAILSGGLRPDTVVVDRHAKCAALNIREGRGHNKVASVLTSEYRAISKAIRTLAAAEGLAPSQYQAVTWLTWRRMVRA